MKKRLVSMLLVLCIVLSILPAVYADDTASNATSGSCGNNLTWTVTDDGTLSITGSGAMDNYGLAKTPWYSQSSSITAVEIAEGVTNIGDSFAYCCNITNVTIPASVTSIGYAAFSTCSNLTSITFAGNAPSIAKSVFFRVSATAYYPAGNETWTEDVMQNYNGTITWIASGDIHTHNYKAEATAATCTERGYTTYTCNCGDTYKQDYTDSLGHNKRYVDNGDGTHTVTCVRCDYNVTEPHTATDGTCPCQSTEAVIVNRGSCGENLSWTLSDKGLLKIEGSGAMVDSTVSGSPWYADHANITAVEFPEGLTSVGVYAFAYCSELTSVTLPDSATIIANGAFNDCISLSDVSIPDSVVSIGDGAFSRCSSLASIKIPNSVTGIGYCTFSDCTALSSVTISAGATNIGVHAFYGCASLESVTIPESVESISSGAFGNCAALTNISFDGNAPVIAGDAFNGVTTTAYYPPNNDTWTDDVMQNYGGSITWTQTHVHSYTEAITAPTCTEQGYTTYTCECGDSYVENYTAALGHSFTNYVYNNDAQIGKDGTETAVCDHGCDTTDTRTKPDSALPEPIMEIKTQPSNGEALVGESVVLSFEAVNVKKYQWYYSKDGGENWTKLYWTGYNTDTLTVNFTASRAAYLYRCTITDKSGNTLDTETVSIARGVAPDGVITKQPESVVANIGDEVYFSISAENAVSYQWYYSNDNGATWTKLYWEGAQTDTLKVTVNNSRYGYIYHCKIVDGNGKATYSTRCYLRQSFSITSQPKDITADYGDTVTLTVSAKGVASYQWYYSKDNGATWNKLYWPGYKTQTLTVEFTESRSKYIYRCELVDYNGTTVTTNTAKVKKAAAPAVITEQPQNVTASVDDSTTLSLTAYNAAKYQWYYSKDDGATWTKLYFTGYNTDTLTVSVTKTRATYSYRCTVTGTDGNTIDSSIVKITLQ